MHFFIFKIMQAKYWHIWKAAISKSSCHEPYPHVLSNKLSKNKQWTKSGDPWALVIREHGRSMSIIDPWVAVTMNSIDPIVELFMRSLDPWPVSRNHDPECGPSLPGRGRGAVQRPVTDRPPLGLQLTWGWSSGSQYLTTCSAFCHTHHNYIQFGETSFEVVNRSLEQLFA